MDDPLYLSASSPPPALPSIPINLSSTPSSCSCFLHRHLGILFLPSHHHHQFENLSLRARSADGRRVQSRHWISLLKSNPPSNTQTRPQPPSFPLPRTSWKMYALQGSRKVKEGRLLGFMLKGCPALPFPWHLPNYSGD